MNKHIATALLSVAWCLAAPAARGVELAITARAATVAFSDAAFRRDGKYDLIRPAKCIYTYLERPAIGFANDRITVRLHLSARAGQEVAGECVGAEESFWLTISGTPYVDGAIVGVKNARVVQIDNPSYRVLIEVALQQGLVRWLRHDVGASVRKALAKDVQRYRLTVDKLTIRNLRARDNVLRATIDFELSGDAAQ